MTINHKTFVEMERQAVVRFIKENNLEGRTDIVCCSQIEIYVDRDGLHIRNEIKFRKEGTPK